MDLTKIAEFANPIISAVFGAPGLWALVKTKTDRNDNVVKLVLSVSRNQLIEQGKKYLDRGYLTMDEYEEYEAEYQIYSALGGNGLAHRIFEQVDDLPMLTDKIIGRKKK